MNRLSFFDCLCEAEVCERSAFLNLCAREGLHLRELESREDTALRFTLKEAETERASALAERCGGGLRVLRASWRARLRERFRRHTLLLLCGGAFGLLLLSSSLFLWRIEPETCPDTLSEWRLRGALDAAGLRVGAFVPSLSTELICSAALQSLPELGSLTVNIRGSRAVISCSEAVKPPAVADESGTVELIASRAALVTELSVLSGTAAVNPGMAVKKGEVLLRPASTSPHARGMVKGCVLYEKSALLAPAAAEIRKSGKKESCWGFRWGKRCIFLQRDSSISPMVCGKIYSASSSALPFGLCRVTWEAYEAENAPSSRITEQEVGEKMLAAALAKELGKDGELLVASLSRSAQTLCLRCECIVELGEEHRID